jgi:3-dehydroquinate synthetase
MAEIPGGDTPDAATLFKIMGQDKKVRDGKLTLILVRGIGTAYVSRDVPTDTVHGFLERQLGT